MIAETTKQTKTRKTICNYDCFNCIFGDCVNNGEFGRTPIGFRIYPRANQKASKTNRTEHNKAYREANKEKIAEYQRAYRKANREKLNERSGAYYKAKKAKKESTTPAPPPTRKELIK